MTAIIETHREDHLVAWMAALAITIHIAESALPSPLPGVKPGLANVVTLLCLTLFGWNVAAWVTGLRVLVGSLVLGTFLTPTFMLSFSGAVCSLVSMGVLYKWSSLFPKLAAGPIGYGITASMAHMCGQFFMAYFLFIPHSALFRLLPILMTLALVFGIVSGCIASYVLNRYQHTLDADRAALE